MQRDMRKYSVPFLVILLCTILFMAFPCKADIVWSDDFDDGNYDGWYVGNGTFFVVDHTLKPVLFEDNPYRLPWSHWINHLSTVTNGTWSFDVLVGEGIVVWLMYDSVEYGLVVASFIDTFGTHLRLDSVSSAGANVSGEYIFNGGISSWQHIDVTRNLDGRTCVYLNGTLCIDVVDHVVRKSWFFMLDAYRDDAIDNIVVSNTVDIEPPSPPLYMQSWFIATVFTVVATVVVIVVLLMRKKMTDDLM
jgi:hypothetical protein